MTAAFLVVLGAGLAIRLYLAARQMRHVAAHRDAVPAAFENRIGLDAHRKAADYTIARTRFGIVRAIAGAILLLIWTLGGGIELLASLVGAQGIGGGTLFLLIAFLVSAIPLLPFDLYRTFVIEERFGFNRTSGKLFVLDMVKGVLLGGAIGAPLAAGALWILAHGGTWWWIWLWVAYLAFSFFFAWAWPTFLAPIFFKFTPLPDGELKERVRDLLDRTGYDNDGIFIMDGSRRSAHANAFFAGLGKRKRVVLFDTLCEMLQTDELESVLAHEIGHAKLRHIRQRIVAGAIQTLLVLGLFAWLRDQPWFQAGLGVQEATDATALLLLLWVGPVFAFPIGPLWSYWSRVHEYEADAYARDETSADALARALVRLYETNASTLTPDPLHSAYYDSHPPAALRLGRLET
ncbi:MAG: M48 family metallopeptidase [Planctomycetota bacterium]